MNTRATGSTAGVFLFTTMAAGGCSAPDGDIEPINEPSWAYLQARNTEAPWIAEVPPSDTRVRFDDVAGTYQLDIDGRGFGRSFPQKSRLYFRRGAVDPLARDPRELIPADLRAHLGVGPDAAMRAYLVQLAAQPTPDMQAHLRKLGARLLAPFPDHGFVTLMSDDTAASLTGLPFVRWVGPYHPGFKLDEALDARVLRNAPSLEVYSVMVLEPEMQEAIGAAVEELDGQVVLRTTTRRMEVRLTGYGLGAIARRPEVLFIDEPGLREPDADIAREIGGADDLETVRGYTGQGVRAEVMDSGLRTTHQDFQANPAVIHTGNGSSTSHGTAVHGIVFGSGAADAAARGLLPDAQQPIFSSYTRLGDRMSHTARLVDPTGPYRAVFQTNSWGNSRTRSYSTISAEMDDILFRHDIAVTQSQSNAGNQDSRPQAWAKNIISVGGVRHYGTLGRGDDQWAGGASIGPATDGRIKPDLWHFYDDVLAPSSSSDTAHRQFGGTSAATPITAGYLGLVFQMWADGVFAGGPGLGRDVFDARPHMTTAKALLVNTAHQYPFSGTNDDKNRVHQGWGMADVENLHDRAQAGSWSLPVLVDETRVIAPTQVQDFTVSITNQTDLKATLVYADPAGTPSASRHRVNDLSLRVTSPSGVVYWGNGGLDTGVWSSSGGTSNDVDTVENVFLQSPASGAWTVSVLADAIVQDGHVETQAVDADYALVVTTGGGGSANSPPVLGPISDRTVAEGQTLAFTVSATDPDGDPITYSASSLPSNATLNASTGAFELTPDFTQAGTYTITFTASDGRGGTDSQTMTITVTDVSLSYAPVPYSSGFESGALDEYWSTFTSASAGRVEVTGSHTPRGSRHLTMDVSSNGSYSTNEAWLRLDLSGKSGVEMSFWWKEFSDESDPEDGVYFSDDGGTTFTKVRDLVNGSSTYTQITLDVDALASANGLSLNGSFVVKLQQRDNYGISTDGFAFDDVRVDLARPYASFPYSTGFESGALDPFWTTATSDPVGRVQVTSANTPRGTQHLTMDVASNGTYSTNEASLRVDLSGQSQVELSFWWKEFSDESDPEDGVYFSDDGGSTFTKVRDLVSGSSSYTRIALDVDALASANGLSLSSTFVVRFQQRDNYGISTDGFAFDDVSLSSGGGGPATIHASDFESGSLAPAWTTQSSAPVGRIQLTSSFSPRGSRHLTMDVSSNGSYSTNEARLALDLSGYGQVDLTFWWKEFSDETDPEDGVFISDDGGATFVKVHDLANGTSTYTQVSLDIDALAASAGLSLTSSFVVRFQQRDNYAITTDGFAFDDILVTGAP